MRAQDLVGEVERPRVEDVRDAERGEEARFSALPAVAKTSAPSALGQLHRGQADAAGGGVDQHPLARRAGAPAERRRVLGREERDGTVGRSAKRQSRGLRATSSARVVT